MAFPVLFLIGPFHDCWLVPDDVNPWCFETTPISPLSLQHGRLPGGPPCVGRNTVSTFTSFALSIPGDITRARQGKWWDQSQSSFKAGGQFFMHASCIYGWGLGLPGNTFGWAPFWIISEEGHVTQGSWHKSCDVIGRERFLMICTALWLATRPMSYLYYSPK